MENIDLSGYDLVLSSSHAVAKGIIPESSAIHVCYCHTPMRYAWEMEEEYLDDFKIPRVLRFPLRRELAFLRRWDLSTSKRVDFFIANSTTTRERIARIYGRDSVVIHPPVSRSFFEIASQKRDRTSFLAVGRLVPYKRFDLLIRVANALDLPLSIAGTGSDERRLKRLAGRSIRFLGYVSDGDLPSLYAEAKALLFPQVEDAGVVPLEAQACGTPVIALSKGGALDTVKENETGIFFHAQTEESLQDALKRFQTRTFDRDAIRAHAEQFSSERFRRSISSFIEELSHP